MNRRGQTATEFIFGIVLVLLIASIIAAAMGTWPFNSQTSQALNSSINNTTYVTTTTLPAVPAEQWSYLNYTTGPSDSVRYSDSRHMKELSFRYSSGIGSSEYLKIDVICDDGIICYSIQGSSYSSCVKSYDTIKKYCDTTSTIKVTTNDTKIQ
jgi:hypothetical protein